MKERKIKIERKKNIRIIIEEGIKLKKRSKRIERIGGIKKREEDRDIVGGEVKSMIDRKKIGVGWRMKKKMKKEIEGLIGVMEKDVILENRRKEIEEMLEDKLREKRIVGEEFKVIERDGKEIWNNVKRKKELMKDDEILGKKKINRKEDEKRIRYLKVKLDEDKMKEE